MMQLRAVHLRCGRLLLLLAELLQYNRFSRRLDIITKTLEVVAWPLIWTLVSVSPVFVGFALAGTQLFGAIAPSFSTFPETCCTLFSLMIGDECNAAFRQVSAPFPIFGRIYMFAFLSTFYFAIANVFIVLVEGAHVMSMQMLYGGGRPGGQSKTAWSAMGMDFARYVERMVGIFAPDRQNDNPHKATVAPAGSSSGGGSGGGSGAGGSGGGSGGSMALGDGRSGGVTGSHGDVSGEDHRTVRRIAG